MRNNATLREHLQEVALSAPSCEILNEMHNTPRDERHFVNLIEHAIPVVYRVWQFYGVVSLEPTRLHASGYRPKFQDVRSY